MTQEISIITVHGTGDSAESDTGEKWWQKGSPFAERLQARLKEARVESRIEPFIWSGANNAFERERASEKLCNMIKRVRRTGRRINVIAHSHGGNVANDAAIDLHWGRTRKGDQPIASLITIGTPYLKSPVTQFQRWGAYVFSVIAILGAVVLGVAGAASLVADFLQGWRPQTGLVLALLATGAVLFFFMVREALQGMRRVGRSRIGGAEGVSIYSITHPADEAVSALVGIEKVEIAPFPPWSMLQGSRIGGILWAVRIVLVFVVGSSLLLLASLLGLYNRFDAALGVDPTNAMTYLSVFGIMLGAGAALWFGVYLLYRLLFGLVPEVLARGRLNRMLQDVFRGMAFGSVGDQRPGAVRTTSYAFDTEEMPFDETLKQKLMAKAEVGVTLLLAKYRADIFNINADYKDLFTRIPKDTQTWDGLVHTTYFDHEEIVEAIAHRIVRGAHAGSHANAAAPSLAAE
jgi:hypothetical protein